MKFEVAHQIVEVNGRDEAQVLALIEERLRAGEGFAVATLNLDHLVKLERDAAFRSAYASHDIVTADGHPIVWMARAAGRPLQLIPGSDLMRPAIDCAVRAGRAVALVGSTPDSLSRAAANLRDEVAGLDLRATISPRMGFDPDGPEAEAILRELAAQGVRLVLVGLGAPKQERFAALGRRLCPEMGFLCIGAGIDFVAGAQHRAPLWVRKMALEWLWRAASDPKRLARRYVESALVLPKHMRRSLAARAVADAERASNVTLLEVRPAAASPAFEDARAAA